MTPDDYQPAHEQATIRLAPQAPVIHDDYGPLGRRPAPAEFDAFRHYLPTRGHHVYELADGSGGLLYVGQSQRPRLRLRRHWLTQPWWEDVRSITLTAVADELAARRLELRLHQQLTPAHSRVLDVELHRIAALAEEVR